MVTVPSPFGWFLSSSGLICPPYESQLPTTRRRHHHTFHLDLRGQIVLCPSCLQGRFSAGDVFGRRVDNVEYNPGGHDAVNDGLQPMSKNRSSCHGLSGR